MGYLLLACPKCHAAYKILSDHAKGGVTCRQCGHKWDPLQAAAEAAAPEAPHQPTPAAPLTPIAVASTTPPTPAAPARPKAHADALAALAAVVRGPGAAPAARPAAKPAAGAEGAAVAAPTPREEKTDPLVGTHLDGFKIQGRIGSGGFGVVYRAFDTSLERSVALKLLPPNLVKAGPGLVDRFLREARSAAKLSHPNIVTIHQICPYKDTFYIVMELVDGGALHEFLAVQKRFKPKEATRIIRAAAEGLAHAHLRGVIHRDIKPGNIMMTNDGQVKVSDFGLARDVMQREDIVGPGHSLGTPRYMSPEQAMGEEPTAASDLYSLAATYFVLLTGRAPFDSTSDRDIMKMHVAAPIPDPRETVPDLPVAVFRFLEKAMAKDPEERFQTAQDFIEGLDRLDFTATDDDSAATPQAVSAQIGQIASEDRGSHLSEVLGRAVKRAQRHPTPSPMSPRAGSWQPAPAKKSGAWKLWVLIGAVVLVLIGGAIAVALILAWRAAGRGTDGTPPATAQTPAGTTEPPKTPGEKPPTETQPPTTPGETTPPTETKEPPTPADTREADAEDYLKSARAFEANPNAWITDKIAAYENVVKMYAGTKAAKDAQQAIDRLRRGSDAPAPETPAPEKTEPEKPEAEKPEAEKPEAEKPEAEKPAPEKPEAEKPAPEEPAPDDAAGEK